MHGIPGTITDPGPIRKRSAPITPGPSEATWTEPSPPQSTDDDGDDFDVVGFLIAYESGALESDEIVEGFQHLIDSGDVWNLQGHYGRTAVLLIRHGYCHD